ncbi:GNAT family N-acetyltransferase [Actinomycetospora flava]|uniref:Nodulation protein A n=1 Tax=Actinomycetospora flava TaxID=3129232 RepID=A0ABU8MCP2_9PSEU
MTAMATSRTWTGPAVRWTHHWETALEAPEHRALAGLLARSYPATPTVFSREHSWAGARPELRVLGRRDGRIVAHAAVVRRFLRTPGPSVLVGDVGLVAVHPDEQGTGLGAELMDAVAMTLAELGLPFGFLTCDPDVRPFYRRCGWTPLAERVRSIRVDDLVEDRRHGMVLPVHRSLGDWPAGSVTRDGQEI